MAQTTYPLSQGQSKFIRALLAERKGMPDAEAFRDSLNKHRVEKTLDSKVGKAAIDGLLKIKVPLPECGPGYYVYEGQVYVVKNGKAPYFRKYAMRLRHVLSAHGGAKGKWVYEKGGYPLIAKHGSPLTVEQAAAMGHLHGYCVVCGRTLTDPKSVQAGIGPVCIKSL